QPICKYWQSALLILFVLIGVLMNDTGAYFVGILFGKHKMNPRISPKKTWEGFIGGIAVSMICSLLWATLWSIGGFPILPILDHTHWYWVLIASILLPIMGDIGDFVFSAIKRHFGVKDFSQLIPGHGGILDRIDSVIFASAFVAALIVFMVFIGAV
ncbi:MAG: phosphatidate cytidylyltransferase, partial [Clostridia bacterium]|nr:phosphatidate cytidylyltransferase [Clostridia bacterium]